MIGAPDRVGSATLRGVMLLRISPSRVAGALRLAAVLALVCAGAGAAAVGCSEDVEVGANLAPVAHAGAGGGGNAVLAGAGPCEESACLGRIFQCGDCWDNDADGLADSADPDCLGPCDNTEDSYYGGIPGQNAAPCKQDCYFDRDTGSGNDDCNWSHECDPLALPPDYPPSGDAECRYDPAATTPGTDATCEELGQVQSDLCLSYCLPLTPNGCDCFGCCELPAGSGQFVWLGSTANGVGSCDEQSLDDPTLCRPCTPVASCFNDCKHCEVCVGKTGLPPECGPPGGGGAGGQGAQCDPPAQPCGQPGQERCTPDKYCISGCCVLLPE